MPRPLAPLSLLAGFVLLMAAKPVHANDFPTVDRVLYVQECLRAHAGALVLQGNARRLYKLSE